MSLLEVLGGLNDVQVNAEEAGNEQLVQDVQLLLDVLGEEDENQCTEAEAEIMRAEMALEYIERNIASLEGYYNTFQEAIKDGGVTQETLNALTPSISSDCDLVGGVFSILSTESMKDARGRIYAAELSCESLKDSIGKAYNSAVKLFERIIDWVAAFYKKHVAKVGRFQKKAAKLAEVAKNIPGTPGDAKVSIPKDYFVENKMITAKNISEMAKFVNGISKDNKRLDDSIKALGDAYSGIDASSDAAAKTSVEAVDAAVNAMAETVAEVYEANKDATSAQVDKKKLPKETEYDKIVATETLPGNFVVVVGIPGSKTDRMPSVSVLPTTHKTKVETIAALGKSEIVNLSEATSELAKAIWDLSERFDRKAADGVKKGTKDAKNALDGAKELNNESREAIKARIKQMRQVASLVREPATTLVTRLTNVGMAAYNVAYKSAKAHKA